MLLVKVNGQLPGSSFKVPNEGLRANFVIDAKVPPNVEKDRILKLEVSINGEVRTSLAENRTAMEHSHTDTIDESCWAVVRCTMKLKNGNVAFAHSAPFFFEHATKPLRPRKVEMEYLLKRMDDELKRHRGVLSEAQLSEFEHARKFYAEKAKLAK